jgi:hypothetical protein
MKESESNAKALEFASPSIDVIVNFLDEFDYVLHAISSLRNSIGVSLRIILMDDSGQDNTNFFCSLLESTDIYLRTERQGYIEGLKMAGLYLTSEFVGILNADDVSEKNRLRNQISKLKSGDFQLCIGRLIKFRGVKWSHLPSVTRAQRNPNYCYHMLYLGPNYSDATWVMQRENFRYLFESSSETDWGIALERFQELNIAVDYNSKYYYRQHVGQTTRIRSILFKKECRLIANKILEEFGIATDNAFIECLATPWRLVSPIDFLDFHEFNLRLIDGHRSVCSNSKSFNLELFRRLLIVFFNPRNPIRGLKGIRVVVTHPWQTLKFLCTIFVAVLLRSGRRL